MKRTDYYCKECFEETGEYFPMHNTSMCSAQIHLNKGIYNLK